MERIEIVAKTLDEAIASALKQLHTTRERISVRIVDEGSRGLFGLGAKDAKIVVNLKDESEIVKPAPAPKAKETREHKKAAQAAPKKTSAPKAAVTPIAAVVPIAPRTERSEPVVPKSPEEFARAQKAAVEFVTDLIQRMNIDCTADAVIDTRESVKVVLTGEGVGAAIGRRGDTLDAIQYLTNLVVNKGHRGDDYIRITVDTENYRAKREETLVRLAHSMASKVIKFRKDMSLEPMNPYERRIIHAALQDHHSVKTVSIGDEPNRRVLISVKR